MQKPNKLKIGDTVAVISPSAAGPHLYPYRYNIGKNWAEEILGLSLKEMPNSQRDQEWLSKNPRARADDLMQALEDPNISGILTSTGGPDCERLLPYLDSSIMEKHPKVFIGFSGSTSLHFAFYKANVTSFYGASIMADFAENGGVDPYMAKYLNKTLFSNEPVGSIHASDEWISEYLFWDVPDNQLTPRRRTKNRGWTVLNGSGIASGHLIGGCLEVLEIIKGTPFWPTLEQWRGALLFIETSWEMSPTHLVHRWIRNYGLQGILNSVNGILIGRPGSSIPLNELSRYDDVIKHVVTQEFGLTDLPILSQLDFGHSAPSFPIPYGIQAEMDCDNASLRFLESGVL